jgi:hypothetical protein
MREPTTGVYQWAPLFAPTSLVIKSLGRCRTVRLLFILQLLWSPVLDRSHICNAAGFITHKSVESGWQTSDDEVQLTTPGHQTPGGAVNTCECPIVHVFCLALVGFKISWSLFSQSSETSGPGGLPAGLISSLQHHVFPQDDAPENAVRRLQLCRVFWLLLFEELVMK